MSRKLHIALLVLLGVFLFAFFRALDVGMLGHDYFYFFPKLLDGQWHFLRQGLRPFWYTAHFCGGLPEFGNPQSLYYSMPQLLSLFLDLWVAARLSMLLAMIAGYAGWYRFGRDLVLLQSAWAHLLALIVTAHGFHFMHMVPGHIVFHGMPLLGWMLWLLFERTPDTRRSLLRKAAWFALLVAYALYSGGYMIGLMGFWAALTLLPYELLLHARNRDALRSRTVILAKRVLACGAAALLIGASKLVAVWSFMRFLPRDLPFERFPEGASALWYMLKAFWAIPQGDALFAAEGMPDWGAVHEYSMAISPVVLIGLLCGCILLWRHRTALRTRWRLTAVCTCITVLLLIFFLQLARGYGWMVTPLESLPVFRSLHVNMRYLYAFSFLPIAAAAWSMQRIVAQGRWAPRSPMVAWLGGAATVLAFVLAYAPLVRGEAGLLPRTMPYNVILRSFERYEGFLEKHVDEVFDMRGLGHSGFVPFFMGGNHAYCHEPMLWGGGAFNREDLQAAPVGLQWRGAYNLYNPACMQYPEANDCEPGDRIAIGDEQNLLNFVHGEPTTWKISRVQRVANWMSLLTFAACAVIAGISCIRKLKHAMVRRAHQEMRITPNTAADSSSRL